MCVGLCVWMHVSVWNFNGMGIFLFIYKCLFFPHPSIPSLQKSVRTGCHSMVVCVAASQLSLTV